MEEESKLTKQDSTIKKFQTMNTIYVRSTLDKPNIDLIITSIATIIHTDILKVKLLKYDY